MLQLLQQRTKLSGKIGAMKRRHGAVVYVPERERDLLARLVRLNNGRLPARAVAAVYREILSSSRAAQGQTPIGLLKASAAAVLPVAHGAFGACDRFAPKKSWRDLANGLGSGELSLALLTGDELAGALASARDRKEFAGRFAVTGDLALGIGAKAVSSGRIYIVTPRPKDWPKKASRILILIECKFTPDAIKTLLPPMSAKTFHAQPLSRHGATVVRVDLARPFDGNRMTQKLIASGKVERLGISLLGIYPATEVYGG